MRTTTSSSLSPAAVMMASQMMALWLLTLCSGLHGLVRNSSASLNLRLIRYENPAGLLIDGLLCDSGRSLCDPSFDVTVLWSGGPDIRFSSSCTSNTNQIDFTSGAVPSLASAITGEDGAMPITWAVVMVTVKDCLFDRPMDIVGHFQLNLTGFAAASAAATAGGTLEMQPVGVTPSSIKLTISVWPQCSQRYYGDLCDRYCEAADGSGCCCDRHGELQCSRTSECWSETSTVRPSTAAPGVVRSGVTVEGRGGDDKQANMMFAAVLASCITSFGFLSVVAMVAIRMCKSSESNAVILRRMASQDTTSATLASEDSFVQQQQLHHLQHGFVNLASYNTLATGTAAGRADSGVYEDPPEPPTPPTPPPPLPVRPQPTLPSGAASAVAAPEEVQRLPQSKSYSRKA